MITNKGEDEIVEGVLMEKEEVKTKKEQTNNQGNQEDIRVTIGQLIDEKSPWRRIKKQIFNDPDPRTT